MYCPVAASCSSGRDVRTLPTPDAFPIPEVLPAAADIDAPTPVVLRWNSLATAATMMIAAGNGRRQYRVWSMSCKASQGTLSRTLSAAIGQNYSPAVCVNHHTSPDATRACYWRLAYHRAEADTDGNDHMDGSRCLCCSLSLDGRLFRLSSATRPALTGGSFMPHGALSPSGACAINMVRPR